MQRSTLALGAFLILLAAAPLAKAQNATNIYAALLANNLTSLAELVDSAGLRPTLSNPNLNVTLFAPTNDAIDMFDEESATLNFNATVVVPAILLYHVSPNTSITFRDNLVLPTLLASQNISNTTTNIVVRNYTEAGLWYLGGIINGAVMNVSSRINVGRSQIYTIDSVMIPPSRLFNISLTLDSYLRSDGNFTLLRRLITADPTIARLALEPNLAVTFFAPTDAAMNATLRALNLTIANLTGTALARRILQNHIVPVLPIATTDFAEYIELPTASNVTTDVIQFSSVSTDEEVFFTVAGSGNAVPANLTLADVPVAMSAVHVIDGVILPSLNTTNSTNGTNSTRPTGRRRVLLSTKK